MGIRSEHNRLRVSPSRIRDGAAATNRGRTEMHDVFIPMSSMICTMIWKPMSETIESSYTLPTVDISMFVHVTGFVLLLQKVQFSGAAMI